MWALHLPQRRTNESYRDRGNPRRGGVHSAHTWSTPFDNLHLGGTRPNLVGRITVAAGGCKPLPNRQVSRLRGVLRGLTLLLGCLASARALELRPEARGGRLDVATAA